MKKCHYCAEMIKDEAILCRYCGSDLSKTPQNVDDTANIIISLEKNIQKTIEDVKYMKLRDKKRYPLSENRRSSAIISFISFFLKQPDLPRSYALDVISY